MTTDGRQRLNAVAVYCASSIGKKPVFEKAAISLGEALAHSNRRLVYGGGSRGIMGVVSGAVLGNGGHATGVIPYAMVQAGGEKEAVQGPPTANGESLSAKGVSDQHATLSSEAKERLEVVLVQSMHERKVKMAERVGGFVGLPGGFGTFEEIFEVTTWTQIGIHVKPVVLLNVCGYYEPLKQMIRNGISEGFIHTQNGNLIVFVDGPEDHAEHETFNWGGAALEALDGWKDSTIREIKYDWSTQSTYSST